MPVGEIETHPYLEIGHTPNARKLILGSFPVYECTDPDNDRKRLNRNEGTVRFFYGSHRNSLWQLFSRFVDDAIVPPWSQDQILLSLMEKGIAISGTIISCERYLYKTDKQTSERILYPFCSEDSALHVHEWNIERIQALIQNGVSKIICTSKGVLATLENRIIKYRGLGALVENESEDFQHQFIYDIDGNPLFITKPTHRVFRVNGNTVMAVALPSPGSPQRQLKRFGFEGQQHWKIYADLYFQKSFDWLMA